MARRVPQRGKNGSDNPDPEPQPNDIIIIRAARDTPPQLPPASSPTTGGGFALRTRTWVIGLVIAALGGLITDSLKGTFGGLTPSVRRLACVVAPGPRTIFGGEDKLNFLVFDLYGDDSGAQADRIQFALQNLGHRAERSCERFGSDETARVQPGPLLPFTPSFYGPPSGEVSTVLERASGINATVAIFGGVLSDDRVRLTVVTPLILQGSNIGNAGGFVLDVAQKDPDWPSKSGLFEKLSAVPPSLTNVNQRLASHLRALTVEPLSGKQRASVAEAYVDVVHKLQATALPPSPMPVKPVAPNYGGFTPIQWAPQDDSKFWRTMADWVGYLADLTRRVDYHLVALAYQSWVFRFGQTPVSSTLEQRKAYADRVRRVLATRDLSPAYAMRVQALRLCAPPEYRAELFGDAAPSAPGFQKAQADFRQQFSALTDYPDIGRSISECIFTPQLGFFPRWPPWRQPQVVGPGLQSGWNAPAAR